MYKMAKALNRDSLDQDTGSDCSDKISSAHHTSDNMDSSSASFCETVDRKMEAEQTTESSDKKQLLSEETASGGFENAIDRLLERQKQ